MKITFQNNPDMIGEQHIGSKTVSVTGPRSNVTNNAAALQKGYQVNIESGLPGYGFVENESISRMHQEAGLADSKVTQDYMILMSNILSDEDYGRMLKEGFDPSDMTAKETVTILDKIKAELARSGKQIAGFNDDLSEETLEQALGSRTLAIAVNKSFEEAGLMPGPDELAEIKEAWDMAGALHTPSQGALQYMVREGLESEIADFYLAQNSGAGEGNKGTALFYAEEVQGYLAQAAGAPSGGATHKGLADQIDKVIRMTGREPNEENRSNANWLLGRNLPLTPENLNRYIELKNVEFPVSEQRFADAVVLAVEKGRSPKAADISGNTEDLYKKANRLLQYYQGEQSLRDLIGHYTESGNDTNDAQLLSERRLLEEVRLRMTTEVNIKLLRSGFSFDTEPMEELVEALGRAEKQVAGELFPNQDESVRNYRTYTETGRIVQELPMLPAKLLGAVQFTGIQAVTLTETYHAGLEMRSSYEAARESYETLMTAPRADLGDNIRKAFANVDLLLEEIGYELNEETRKAVRVLGYNRMDITGEHIDRVLAAQKLVDRVTRKMTPAAVLDMIRDGENPLNKTFEELEEYLDARPVTEDKALESYSRFLYRLERTGDITEAERESYIGIYRMLHQIEKHDQAAIGGVLRMEAELNFSNLLSAARNGNFAPMDIRLTAQEQEYMRLIRSTNTIDDQIGKAYQKQEAAEVRSAALVGNEGTELLARSGEEFTPANLLAAENLLETEDPFLILRRQGADKKEAMQKLVKAWENMDDRNLLEEEYGKGLTELHDEVTQLAWQAENSLDVKELRLASRQLNIMMGAAATREYFLPFEADDGTIGKMHLRLEQAESVRGTVAVTVELGESTTHAVFSLRDGKVSGILQGNGREEVMRLSRAADILDTYLKEESSWSMDAALPVVDLAEAGDTARTASRGKNTLNKLQDRVPRGGDETGETDPKDLLKLAKLWIRAVTRKEEVYED